MKTYFVDTNYFLRLLLKEDEKQFNQVYFLFQKAIKGEVKLCTSVVVLFEIYWVLSSFYKKNKLQVCQYLEKILMMNYIEIEKRETFTYALSIYKKNPLDLEDCYNLAIGEIFNVDEFASFDKKLLKCLKK